MFVRMRWFTIGVVASLGVVAYAVNQLRRARERLSAENIARQAGRALAGTLESAARRVDAPGVRR